MKVKQGDLVDNIWYDKDGLQKHHTKFVYVYDQENNWITRKRLSNGELNYNWERVIEYYKK